MAESKSARKNKKRREKKAAGGTAEGFKLEEDVPGVGTTPLSNSVTRTEIVRPPSPVDPIADIKRQIEEAKAAKDHSRAQELRQKMWVLQDTVVLGRAGPGAPPIDIQDALSSTSANQKATTASPSASSPATNSTSTSTTEKKLNRLHKKLAQVEALKERQAKGEQLEANQVTKIQTESEILEEISILEDILRSHAI